LLCSELAKGSRPGHQERRERVMAGGWGAAPLALVVVELPVCWRLWPQLDVGNIRIAVCVRASRRLAVFRILTACGLLLAPLDERFLSFAFCSGGSSVSGHAASSAYTIRPRVATVLACKFRARDSQRVTALRPHLAETGSRQTVDGDHQR
jgi:hypothetical protein